MATGGADSTCAGVGDLTGRAVPSFTAAATRKQNHYKQRQGFCATPLFVKSTCNKCTLSRGREHAVFPLMRLCFPMLLKFERVCRFGRQGEFFIIYYWKGK